MKIGFAGLGQMGRPIALNLLKSGAELTVCDQSDASFVQFTAKGAVTTKHIRDFSACDVIFLCLPNDKVVRAVVFGDGGVASFAKPGQIVVDLSTVTYKLTTDIAKRMQALDVAFLDAPISGMESRAVDGELTVMCGGDRAIFEAVKPLFDCIGNKILYMGGPGAGQLMKLINQLLFDINAAALAEILPMAAKLGLDPDQVGEVVNSGTGRSFASEFFIPRVLRGHFSDGYLMKNAYKDLISGAEIGADLCIPLPVLAAATTTYQMALARGHGDKDKGGMIAVFEELLGVAFRSAQTK